MKKFLVRALSILTVMALVFGTAKVQKAEAKVESIYIKVVDEKGNPVKDAYISADFMDGNSVSFSRSCYTSKSGTIQNGGYDRWFYTTLWDSVDSIKYTISKDGYCTISKEEYAGSLVVFGVNVSETLKKHVETPVPGTPATCTEDGLTDGKKCANCDEILEAQVTIPATGHDYESVIITVPTVDEDGVRTTTCKNEGCTEEPTIEVVPKLSNSEHWDYEVTKPATCTEAGIGVYTNKNNENEKYEVEIPATGHDFGDYTYNFDAALGVDGTETAKCNNCDETDTRTVTGSAFTHISLGFDFKAPTCEEDGYISINYGFMFKSDDADEISRILLKNGCYDASTDIYQIRVTAEELEKYFNESSENRKSLPALGHDMYDVEGTAVAPTTESEGKKADQQCSRCDHYVEGEGIAKLHNEGSGTIPLFVPDDSAEEPIEEEPVVEEPVVEEPVVEEPVEEEPAVEEPVVEEPVVEEPVVEEPAEEEPAVEEETVEVEDTETPEGTPAEEEIVDVETIETPEGTPAEEDETLDILDFETPQGDALPQTGVVSAALFIGFGAICISAGSVIVAKAKRKEDEE